MVINHGPTQKYTDWRSTSNGNGNTYYMKQSQPQRQYVPVTVNQQPQRQYVTVNQQQQYLPATLDRQYVTANQQQQYLPATLDRQYVIRQSNRSSSPVRSPRERGRSTTRQFVYNQQPSATMRVQNVEVQNRSKSAPPVNRGTVKRVVSREPLVFTKSHFMAIRKPGSKKYLLPPTKMYTETKQTNRTVVVERNAPAPRQQQTAAGGVYHVQYNPETANIVRNRGHTISGDHHRMTSAPTTPRYYQQQSQQQQEVVFNRRSTDTKQPIRLATYTPKIIQGTQLTTENRTHTWSAQNGGVANGTTVWSSEDMYATNNGTQQEDMIIRSSSRRGDTYNAASGDPYTIVDFVEDGTTGTDDRQTNGIHDSSGLQELANLNKYLDIESSNSSSPKSGR